MSKWLLVDGFNLAYRCFFAIPELTRADGFPTNALHGWVKSLWRLADQEHPSGTLVFFDLGGARDRLALLPEYKAQRAEMPEALVKQLPLIKSLTRAMGFAGVERDGVESDDLLAAEARRLADAGNEVLIVSSDKDFAQLAGPRVKLLLPPPAGSAKPAGWRVLDEAGVVEKFGVRPAQIADYLALVGDASDNIPGLAGVGPKTAAKWLAQHGTLEGVIAAAGGTGGGALEPERFRDPVRAQADMLRRNLRLTTLNLSLPPVSDAERNAAGQVRLEELLALLEEMEMRTALAEARQRYEQRELF
ncbi:MAG: 5'-3' exonuclease [Opitutaceae bacterium]|nr:5'-3' exonuclease [Opitutaceae bacterium]